MLDKKDSTLYDSRSVYYEGLAGSPEEVGSHLQKHFQMPPVHVEVEGEGYGFLVFASEQQAVEMVSSVRLRIASSGCKSEWALPLEKFKVMLKKDFRAQ